MQYKINQIITVRYLAIDNETGLTDLKLTPTNPSGADQSTITFTEIGDGLYTVSFTPDALGWWMVRVTSLTKPKNIYSKSYFVGTEYTTYPTQEDGKLTSIDTKLGEVQSSPTAYTLLGRLKDLWDKLNDLFTNGLAKLKIWDGTTQVNITTDNKLQTITHGRAKVSSLNSTSTPLGIDEIFPGSWEEVLDYSMITIQVNTEVNSATNGLCIQWSSDGVNIDDDDTYSVIGSSTTGRTFTFGVTARYFRIVYTNGVILQPTFRLQTLLKPFNQKPSSHRIGDAIDKENDAELVKAVLTGKSDGQFVNVSVTPEGRLEVALVPTFANITTQIMHERPHSAINSGEWQEVLEYTVPMGYNLNAILFEAQSQFANEAARAVYKNIMGTFNCSTNTFTNGLSITLPRFATRLYVVVTSDIGSALNDTFTVTYTNAQGVTGRTAVITITKSSLAGTRLEVPLQAGDRGIIDITNVTHSATGQAGAIQLSGYIELIYLTLTSSNTQYQSVAITLGGLVVFEGETVYLQYLAGTKTTYTRRLNLLTALIPK